MDDDIRVELAVLHRVLEMIVMEQLKLKGMLSFAFTALNVDMLAIEKRVDAIRDSVQIDALLRSAKGDPDADRR